MANSKPESVTINDLQSLELDADLTIMFSECPKLPQGRKIHLVGGEPFADRGSLRVAFSAIEPDTFVEVVLYDQVQEKVDIDDSVELDGVKTRLKPPSEWINSDDDEEEQLQPAAGLVAANSPNSGSHQVDPRVKAGVIPSGGGGPSNSPQLLEFTKLDMSSQADFLSVDAGGFSRSGLMDALNNVPRGHAIILLCEMINPVAEVEILSRLMRREFVVQDCGTKLRLRPGQNEVASSFIECMTRGRWYVVLNAQKSINTLRVIDTLMNELRVGGSIKFHPAARIIISTDPHPHFPPGLLEKGITMKLRQSFSRSHMTESLMASVSRRKILGATVGGAIHPGASTSNTSSALGSGTSMGGIGGGGAGGKKRPRVQMSAAVEVVEIPSRDVMASAVSKPNGPITGRIVREKEFTGLEGDKFLCISSCGRGSDRIAVGSSLGNVYFLDYYGQAVSSMHAHDACVWDIDSQSPGSFVTGSEDCSTIRWNASADGTAQQNQVAKCGHDIFAVTFMGSDANSPIYLGGLMSVVVCLSPKGQAQQIPAPSSTQALCAMPTAGKVIGGGGDGSIMVIDAATCGMDQVLNSHKKKVPCVAHSGDSMIVSGSFDCTIKLWDTKSLNDPVHTLKLKNYVTGVGVDGNILAASVGENLYMWDLRMPSEVLGGFPQAWSGLSRGLVVNSDTKQVVTASPDGVVRFWRYQ